MEAISIREVEPSDYHGLISVINAWWGDRDMVAMLPKLFFVHFRQTSFVAECEGEPERVGFLIGFLSQTFDTEAYIHFAGVHPDFRGKGIGRALYERFFKVVQTLGRNRVRCVTSPVNQQSIAFHQRMGFRIEPGTKTIDGIPVAESYDGKGNDRVSFYRRT
jgi:ribosomal protein S18 acetylase RimI-like enzyme